uniref:Cir_N domain-containing protein n=1 Tax=Hydatigena taeniaeformis TaxID=6205 RepID=A0A0R3WRX2_HYDTA
LRWHNSSDKLAVERADLELAKRLQAEEEAAYLKQASESASQSPSCSPSHHRQNGGGYGQTMSSSWVSLCFESICLG